MRQRARRRSGQRQGGRRGRAGAVAVLIVAALLTAGTGAVLAGLRQVVALAWDAAAEGVPPAAAPRPPSAPTPDAPSHERIDREIARVFGGHYRKAKRLLACENASLDPYAVNVNQDGSRDVGVFQINSRWQGVANEAFLTDYRINIRMAWNIYERSRHTFALWSCGRTLGI